MSGRETGILESHEVAIVGAGPVGLELAAVLCRAGVDYVQFEAQQIGHTLTRWPPHTHFFSSPERIALAGVPIPTLDQTKLTGEEYLAYLRSVVMQFGLKVNTYEPVTRIERRSEGFLLHTRRRTGERSYSCRRVVLATGGMAGPRRLGIPGEELPHVSHYVADPHRYFLNRVLIVGGRNSALEAALRLFRAGAKVTISYRRPDFDAEVPKQFLLKEVQMWIREGRICFLPSTAPVEITPQGVILAPTREGQPVEGQRIRFDADFVLLCTGFVADMSLFKDLGVELRGESEVPQFCAETMETNVPGVYVLGTAAAGTQERYSSFIETSHVEVERIVRALTGGKQALSGQRLAASENA